MEHKVSAASIYHDLERGVYYLIDKKTGHTQRAHKNGLLLKSFKLDISGNDYRKRREEEGASMKHQSPIKPLPRAKPTKIVSQKCFSPFRESAEPQVSHSNNLGSIRARSNINNERLKSQQSQPNFLTNFGPFQGTESTHMASESTHMGSLLQSFSKLNQQKVKQNHCWLDKAAGTVLNPPMLNSRGFRETKNMIYQPEGERKNKTIVRTVSQQNVDVRMSWGRQLSKEKQIFLQFHPSLQQRENIKAINDHLDRKKNIKKLEELFLEQSDKVTKEIYS